LTYFVAEPLDGNAFKASDHELATWAFDEWQRALSPGIPFRPGTEGDAAIRLYSVPRIGPGQVGVTRTRGARGRLQATIFIRPDPRSLSAAIAKRAERDPLYRDVVVYAACLHKIGHAPGLGHTSARDSIMQNRATLSLLDAFH
jgi:hypothetical protein